MTGLAGSSFGSLTGKGKATRTDEGLFIMPVKITFTVTAPDAPCAF